MKKNRILALGLAMTTACGLLAGCGSTATDSSAAGTDTASGESTEAAAETSTSSSSDEQVVIYSNADDEAITAMSNALDNNGYEGKYVFETFGTSELGGKLLAEGTNLEADMVTMSTFYLKSAQEQNNMFLPLTFEVNTLEEVPDYTAPITSQEGAIIINTELMEENNLPTPTCLKDLADPVYSGYLAVTDVKSSSTAWLLLQALISEYGEDEAQSILSQIYENAGDHIESSGSAPLKLCEDGEVAIGFGLRHQAVAAKEEGLPIDYVDPTEGNFSLTESVAVLDKGDDTNALAMEMAECIIEKGREELQSYYPNALYEGESSDSANKSAYPKTFSEELTFELYEHHQEISEAAKP
jgi:iron(III) transport system substrate-binding protein